MPASRRRDRFRDPVGPHRSRAALVAVVTGTLVLTACGTTTGPGVEIPEGVPPAPGVPVPAIDVDGPGRTADLLADWAAPIADSTGVGRTAIEAYGHAAAVMARSAPECGLAWTTLAGIGYVESRHGTFRGSTVGPDSVVSPPIRGVPLDGTAGNAEIRDTDGGELDGDPVLDRAMGPMQFIPETWRKWGVDANGDGRADPDTLDDAALSAGRYLCASGGDLTTPEGWQRALLAYNRSGAYARDVRDAAAAYSVGTSP
ncbi:Transglycosylase SLT domain-containing protein [Rhodococcoides kroppenstedtii]|uniref:Transglycosylase SLT domain-containing protein n=1 Tax=Rhodococcoides kroppenstedtii TaxID=293050 RepID=A0A1I0U3U4_9NOCA|nr:lytic murein transglycosylase [Rhodococcus kroppenstedtii]SFA58761.1 Transglycosylase SLT domain-containing protein [Rhodococcus kroppenstedtii]